MYKKIITNATLQALMESDLIFDAQTFAKKINALLFEHDLELHEKAIYDILKNLQAKDYVDIESEYIFKSNKTILSKNNKQRNLFELLVDEYGDSFDNDYIKYQYMKSIKGSENTPVEHLDFVEDSFKFLSKELGFNSDKDFSF